MVLFCCTARSQWRGLQLHNLGSEIGLGFQVSDCIRDSIGYMYFSGDQGFCRYDGKNLHFFRHDPLDSTSIEFGPTSALAKDKNGIIWISNYIGFISGFDPSTGCFENYKIPIENGFGNQVQSLYMDGDNLWIGCDKYVFYKFNIEKKTFKRYYPTELVGNTNLTYWVESIHGDRLDPDRIWLTIRNHSNSQVNFHRRKIGMFSFNKKDETFQEHFTQGTFLYQYADGTIITSDFENQYLEYQPNSGIVQNNFIGPTAVTTSKRIKAFLDKEAKNQWLIQGDAILESDGHGTFNNIYSIGVGEANFRSAKQDGPLLWLATHKGFNVYDPANNHIDYFSLSKFGEYEKLYPGILTFDKADDILYLAYPYGISTGRIYRINLKQKNDDAADFIDMPGIIHGLGMDNSQQLWAFGNRQFYKFSSIDKFEKVRIESNKDRLPLHCFNMKKNEQGVFGMLSKGEVHFFDPDTRSVHSVYKSELPNSQDESILITSLDFDSEGNAYFFENAMSKMDGQSKTLSAIDLSSIFQYTSIHIEDLLIADDGTFWIASLETLVQLKNVNDQFTVLNNFDQQIGMPNIQVFDLFEDYINRIWCFTSNGLVAISANRKEFRFFGKEHGLPEIHMSPSQVIEVSENRICTVNKNGVILFHPDSLWNSYSDNIPVVINVVKIGGEIVRKEKSWNHTESLKLKVKNNVSISFQGLKLPDAGNLVYSYRLKGQDDKWNHIGSNNTVLFSSLEPGEYSFEVKTGTPLSASPTRTLKIIVPTPIHKSWWFLALVFSSVLVTMYLFYQHRIRAIRTEQEKKSSVERQMNQLELNALRSQMNPHFMFNSLNSIKNYILKEKPLKASEYLSNFSHLIRRILQNSQERAISLADELEMLQLYIDLEQLRVNQGFDFQLSVEDSIDLHNVMLPPMIIQPYVENAIWHGLMPKDKKGWLKIDVTRNNGNIVIAVEDNGIGRKKALSLKKASTKKYKSMGMSITQDRLQLLHSLNAANISVKVIDKPHQGTDSGGTTVVIRFPILTTAN